MPYLKLRASLPESGESAEKIIAILMKHTGGILGKRPEVTAIDIEFASPKMWFIDGVPVGNKQVVTFHLDVKITEGTNTKPEKALYIKNVFSDLESAFGPLAPASYIVLHDVSADSWGFQGITQECRLIQSQTY
jgi:4-oxalocrotonate tautomerase